MAKSGISMQIIGIKELLKNLDIAGDRGIKAVGAGLYLEANNIMTDSKREAPHDIGTLENSGYVTLPNIKGKDIIVEIGYGGAAKEYALAMHEGKAEIKKGKRKGQTIYFKNFQGGKKSKYLQDPLYAAKAGFSKNVQHFAVKAFNANKGARKIGNMPTEPK